MNHFEKRMAELTPPIPAAPAALYLVEPVLIERHCGGWLAITPRCWPLGIGVTADTREEAIQEFRAALKRFERIGTESPHEKGKNMHPNAFNVQIEVEGQTYAVRHLGQPVQHFSSFESLTDYLRCYLPIYPVYSGGGEATALSPLA